jgi:anti-sigma regulatory factor (Ser/Thr protein kinase)
MDEKEVSCMGDNTSPSQRHRPSDATGEGATVSAKTASSGLRWRQVYKGEERQLGLMRRWLASLLPECEARDDVISVATELASNAIRHTASGRGGWFAVEVTWHRSVVQVAIADCGGPGEPHKVDDPDGEQGRGLLLVEALSARTGCIGDQRGRLVWAQVAWQNPNGSAPVSSSPDSYQGAIHDGEAALARRFADVPAWFGRATLQWWALPDSGDLVSAPSASALAALLYRLAETTDSRMPGAAGQPHSAMDKEPGRPVTPEPDSPPRRAGPSTRAWPESPRNNRLDSRARRVKPHRSPGAIPSHAWVLSARSCSALNSGAA